MRLIILLIFCLAGLANNLSASLTVRRVNPSQYSSDYLTKKKKSQSLAESSQVRAKKHLRKSRALKEFAPELKSNPCSFLSFSKADGDSLYVSPPQTLFSFCTSGRAPPIKV